MASASQRQAADKRAVDAEESVDSSAADAAGDRRRALGGLPAAEQELIVGNADVYSPLLAAKAQQSVAEGVEAADSGAVVVFDVCCYRVLVPDTKPAQYEHRRAFRGETVYDLVDAELDRQLRLGAVARPADAQRARSMVVALSGVATDVELGLMSAEEVSAYLTQHPTERQRVHEFELSKSEPRQQVIQAVGALDGN